MRRMLWTFALIIGCGDDGMPPDDNPLGDATARIEHYDYRFDIATRDAHTTLTAHLETPGNCVTLKIRPGLVTTNVLVDGNQPTPDSFVMGDMFKVCGERGHPAGETMTIDADLVVPLATLAQSQVGFSVTNDAQQNPFHYLVSWVGGCDRFGPCDNRPDQFARYTFHVTHPDTLDVRCSGAITLVSATETTCDFTHDGGPTYSTFGIAAYPAWSQIDKGMWGSAKVTLYDRAQTMIDAALDPVYHGGFVAFMESTFGPYPYGNELRVLTAPTYWSGFEHPGNIVLDDNLARGPSAYLRPVAHVLDHEIAHQWAGDETTLLDTYDFVWKEAMAEYLAFVYEDMADKPAAVATASAWKSFSANAAFFPVPGEKPPLFDYYGHVYGPGPLILFRQIEVLSSRAQVLDALKSVLGEPRALSVDDVLAALEAKTGLDLDAYAAAWIRGTGRPQWPRAALTYNVGGATDMLRVQLTAGAERRCKFQVALRGANPDEELLVPVDTFRDGPDQIIPINPQPPFTVMTLVLDPEAECLILQQTVAAPPPFRHPWLSERGHAAM